MLVPELGQQMTEPTRNGPLVFQRFISHKMGEPPARGALSCRSSGGSSPARSPLGSLEALGWRGILWLGPSRLLRSARAGPPPRAPPPLFLPGGHRAQVSAAGQSPGGSVGKLGKLTLQPAPARPASGPGHGSTVSWWSPSPLCVPQTSRTAGPETGLPRGSTGQPRSAAERGHRPARSAAVAGRRWFQQRHQRDGEDPEGRCAWPGPPR